MAEVKILHRWTADNCRWKDGLLSHRDRRDVHLRIEVGQRIETGMVAERPFGDECFSRVDVSLEHEVRFRGHLQIARHGLRQRHSFATQESGEEKLIYRR